MQLRHLSTVVQPASGDNGGPRMAKVMAVAWSPNNRKLAVCTADRVVTLYDENFEKRDKFSTKPAEKGPKNYVVRALCFSPDSSRLAVAQSDCIVFVYKLGLDWGESKSICNKFPQPTPITCMAWSEARPNELVYGLAEGKVKLGQLKSNKPATLYSVDSYCAALAASPDGNGVVSAHSDGSLYRFLFDNNGAPSHTKLVIHPSVPYALSWGVSIVAAGNDGQVVFYDMDGGMERTFDYSSDPSCREFTTASFNPVGDAVVLGNYDSFHVFAHNHRGGTWEEAGIRHVENMYTVTALGWRADGSRLAVGSLCGAVDVYDACVKRTRYKGRFELTYVSLSQVIVKRLSSGSRIVLKSHFACEITKVNIYQDRFVVANTTETLLLGDLETLKLSEIQWQTGGGGGDGGGSDSPAEKFIFDSPSAALIYHASELSIVEYGRNEILGAVRTEHISGHLLSVRLSEKHPRRSDRDMARRKQSTEGTKTVAYLLDAQTINIKNLITNATTSVNHDSRVDWLELNSRADLLLFRDRRRRLHLYNVRTQIRGTLLSYCTYVQWVPDSDVVVAQNRSALCVWYNIHAPDQVTTHQIKGEVYEIERMNECTEVIVNEGYREASYVLDEALIRFGGALDDGEYSLAVSILEPLEVTPEAAAMWQQLGEVALEEGDITIAERCAAALGDVSRARFLHKVSKNAERAAEPNGINGASIKEMQDHWSVRYRLALLKKDMRGAEDVLVSQGKVDEAIEMRHGLQQYEEALSLARSHRLPEERMEEMSREYFRLLLDTKQEERAAALKENEGDYEQAIRLFLKGGMPAQAGRILKERSVDNQKQWLETVATTMSAAGMHDKAGAFYEEMDQLQRAMDSYTRGKAFRQAVELARRSFPSEVVDLQETWGDYLMTQKQVDMAINHYIEARANAKAVSACLTSRQWSKAAQLAETLERDAARPYFKTLARHYADTGSHVLAEKFFVEADAPQLAVEMYTKANRWEAAHKLASSYMSEREVRVLYMEQAQKMEGAGSLLEAEKLYLQVGEVDLAITMYKKAKRYDAMVRLVAKHRPDVLKETNQFLAQQLEMEGSLKDAEHHYAEAGEWLSAVNMYRSNDMWDDALRVAKFHGGQGAHKRVAYAWALALGGEAGAKLLTKQGLIEPAIDYATESGAFDHALELAQACCPTKLPSIHLKHALFLEDEERFKEAEEEFLQAGKPREAIDMFVHQKAWAEACRVAEEHDPPAVSDVLCAQAADAAAAGHRGAAEDLYVRAAKPEKALQCYEEAGMWQEALRVCQRHLPHLAHKVQTQYQAAQALTGSGGTKADYLSAGRALEQNRDWSAAIDAYLKASKGAMIGGDDLEEIWERAITVARMEHPNRHMEVVREVSRRLADLGRHDAAAEVLRAADQLEEAVSVAEAGGAWGKAREVARGQRDLGEKVERAYQQHLMQGEATEELLKMGQTNAALDILAQKGEWDRLWESAEKQGSSAETFAKYAGSRARSVLDDDNNWERPISGNEERHELDDAVLTLEERGAPMMTSGPGRSSGGANNNGAAAGLYKRLVKAVLGRDKAASARQPWAQETLERLVRVLQRQAQHLKNANKEAPVDFDHLLMATHYSCLLGRCRERGGKDCLELACKAAITLLRYSDIIPVDKSFYQAGSLCKDLGNENLAFVLLNRYVDLTEAIEEGNASLLDNSDFAEATNVPLVDGSILPANQHIPAESEREEVRDWVLSVCMDAKIDQTLPPEREASGTLYQGLYASDLPSCVVTGLPIHKRDMLQANNAKANKKDWNAYVRIFKHCPWTGADATPRY